MIEGFLRGTIGITAGVIVGLGFTGTRGGEIDR